MFIRCENQPFMLKGKVLTRGKSMEVSEETFATIKYLVDAKIITVHSSDPEAVRRSRKEGKSSKRDLGSLKKSELISIAESSDISVKSNESKASILEKIKSARGG